MLQGVSLLLAAGVAGGYGQFFQQDYFKLQTIEIRGTAFRVLAPGAPELNFAVDQKPLGFSRANRFGSALAYQQKPNGITRAILETTSLGFSLECHAGATFSADTGDMPFLSWKGGTVGPGVPTPVVNWMVVSWPITTSPLFLSFSGAGASALVSRTGNGYSISVDEKFTGVIRVRTPYGTEAVSATNAAEFGQLISKCEPLANSFGAPAPVLQRFSCVEEGNSLVGTFVFDRPGSVIPKPILDAAALGQLLIESETVNGTAGSVPMQTCKSTLLRIRLFARKLSRGYAITTQPKADSAMPATLSPLDTVGLTESCLAIVSGSCSVASFSAFPEFLEFVETAERGYVNDRLTGLPICSSAEVTSSTLAAGYALAALSQGLASRSYVGALASIDWVRVSPSGELNDAQKAASLFAIATAFDPSAETRFLGALVNASLVAQRVSGKTPFFQLRSWLFPSKSVVGMKAPDWLFAMHSPVRILSPVNEKVSVAADKEIITVSGIAGGPKNVSIDWMADAPLFVVSSTRNTKPTIAASNSVQKLTIEATDSAAWSVSLRRRVVARPIPKAVPSLRYSAIQR